jgi:hypothetical protein
MAILTKFFVGLMNHIIREYAGKKNKLFLNVSPLKIMDVLLSLFKVSSLYLPHSDFLVLNCLLNFTRNTNYVIGYENMAAQYIPTKKYPKIPDFFLFLTKLKKQK